MNKMKVADSFAALVANSLARNCKLTFNKQRTSFEFCLDSGLYQVKLDYDNEKISIVKENVLHIYIPFKQLIGVGIRDTTDGIGLSFTIGDYTHANGTINIE